MQGFTRVLKQLRLYIGAIASSIQYVILILICKTSTCPKDLRRILEVPRIDRKSEYGSGEGEYTASQPTTAYETLHLSAE